MCELASLPYSNIVRVLHIAKIRSLETLPIFDLTDHVQGNLVMETKLICPRKLFQLPVRFEIPEFQRRYIWEKERQWEPLWEDVTDIAENILESSSYEEKHFLGAVVLQPEPSTGEIARSIVIDGQQRLTTLQLMMDAVQEVITYNKHEKESQRLRRLIENEDEDIGDDPNCRFKVWPTVFDRDAFRHAMDDELETTNHNDSLVVRAHEYFKTQTQSWLDAQNARGIENEKVANAIGQAIRLHLELVVIDLRDEDPHLIFETMNARGTPLLQSDMVKNNILHEATVYSKFLGKEVVRKTDLWKFDESDDRYWAQEVGRGFNRRPRIDVFLNHWLTFRNRKITRQYREFEVFRKYSKSEQEKGLSIYDVTEDLSNIAKMYRDIDECAIEEISPFLRRCRTMNLGAVTPLLLWLLTDSTLRQNQQTLSNCVRVLDSFFVRRAVCGFHTRIYAKISEKLLGILNETNESPDRVLTDYLIAQEASGDKWPTDEEFEKRFLEAPLYQWITQGRLRMVLLAIEEQLHTNHSELNSVLDSESLQIEHVMPRSWHAHWPLPEHQIENTETLREHRDLLIHTIGNLTLVRSSFNPVLSNREWSMKKNAIEEHSVLFLNRNLVQYDVWDEDRIRARSGQLFEQARKIWPRPSSIGESI